MALEHVILPTVRLCAGKVLIDALRLRHLGREGKTSIGPKGKLKRGA